MNEQNETSEPPPLCRVSIGINTRNNSKNKNKEDWDNAKSRDQSRNN